MIMTADSHREIDDQEALLRRRQKMRSRAIAGGLVLLCVLFYVITLAKLGAPVLNRPL